MLGQHSTILSKVAALLVALTVLMLATMTIWGASNVSAAQVTSTPGPAAVTCNQLLPLVQKNLKASCAALDGGQICYGNNTNTVTYRDSANTPPFAQPGDTVAVDLLKTVNTAPLNLQTGEWGISVLKARADVPGTVAGQAVTFILYGDTQISRPDKVSDATPYPDTTCSATTVRATYLRAAPATSGAQVQLIQPNTTLNIQGHTANSTWLRVDNNGTIGWLFAQNTKLTCDAATLPTIDPVQPAAIQGMSAFYFSTAIGPQAACANIPAGGLLIQSPKGANVHFRANGADITIGSTVILSAVANHQMVGYVLDGHMTVDSGTGKPQTATTGQKITVPLGGTPNGLGANGAPSTPQLIRASDDLDQPTLCQIARSLGLTMPCALTTTITTRSTSTTTPNTNPGSPAPQGSLAACTFTVNRFSADQNPVRLNANGQACTTLRWDVSGTERVAIQRQGGAAQGVVSPGALNVCFSGPTTFTLLETCGGQTQAVSLSLSPQTALAPPPLAPTRTMPPTNPTDIPPNIPR